MPRSKTAKKTIQKILDVSLKLFNTHGFANVKMQDIIDKLATFGLSKGAIYHHFNNKDDILEAILAQYEQESKAIWEIQHSSHNGRDKIKAIIMQYVEHYFKHRELMRDSYMFFSSSRVLAHRLKHNHICPILESLIEEGNTDGSLNVAYPKAASEMLFWAVYVWIHYSFYPLNQNDYIHKVRHIRMMCEGVGLSVIDEEVSAMLLKLWQEMMR